MDINDLFSDTGKLSEFYNNKANYIEWNVGGWIKNLPEEETPDLSENYREKHEVQTSGDWLSIIIGIFNTGRRAGRNAELYSMNSDAEKMIIQRPLFDMNKLETGLLKMFEALHHLGFFEKDVFGEIRMFIAYNNGSCSLSHKGELSKYGAYSKKELMSFLDLCSIDKRKMLTQGVSIINGIVQSNDVEHDLRKFLKHELDIALNE